MNSGIHSDTPAPVVKRFLIKGLHGYKNVEFDFQHYVKIVIAENGAGKTTILSALEAFLRADFAKLASLQFDTIECDLAGVRETLTLKRSHLARPEEQVNPALAELARVADVEPEELRQAIMAHCDGSQSVDVHGHSLFQRIYQMSPYGVDEVANRLLSIRAAMDKSFSDEAKALINILRQTLKSFDILYLPTFRRIERPLVGRGGRRNRRIPYSARHLSGGEAREIASKPLRSDINYGLSDVEDRLADLSDAIQRRSNMGYRQISTAIIDDLIAGRFGGNQTQHASLPSIEDLRLFFSRLQQSSHDAEHRLSAITKLYESPDMYPTEASPLRYFLAMLATVVNQTKELEADIEQFVEKANIYLQSSSDEKHLVYDAARMKVLVRNTWTNCDIKLDDLSSGEKQVISLLAHVHLYDRKKIILIDEPELSLSMDWQKRLLPDVAQSARCSQLLAITHSPFIFDNELDPYAGPLHIERSQSQTSIGIAP